MYIACIITELDISTLSERLKANKCYKLPLILLNDSSQLGTWRVMVTCNVGGRVVGNHIVAELSNVADECLNEMLLQPSSDNDWMSGWRLIICWLGPRRIVCFKCGEETFFCRKLGRSFSDPVQLKCSWMSWLVMWDWHFNQKIIETKKAGPWREVNVVNYEFHGRQ